MAATETGAAQAGAGAAASASASAGALIAGVDEAGRGPLAGPVVAAAVILPPGVAGTVNTVTGALAGLDDSKRLSATARARLEPRIKQCSVAWAIGVATVAEIDELNILNATLLAMRRALLALKVLPDEAWVDGNRLPRLPCKARTFVGGDARFPVISAASVLAKEYRDRQMRALDARYPQYLFASNKGYGSKAHREALHEHGPCPAHRFSFAPLKHRR